LLIKKNFMLEVLETCWEVSAQDLPLEVKDWLDALTPEESSTAILESLRFYYRWAFDVYFAVEYYPETGIFVRPGEEEIPKELLNLPEGRFQDNLLWSLRNTLQGIWREEIRSGEC
jgi:hypothetical protein